MYLEILLRHRLHLCLQASGLLLQFFFLLHYQHQLLICGKESVEGNVSRRVSRVARMLLYEGVEEVFRSFP